jgi:AcrR family transcriptional regulator
MQMPKGSAELTRARKEEIVAACRKLYETMSFKEITLKDIGQETSFTRTSIYNYFETKEEIFLALFQREYELFVRDLDALCAREESLSRDELADALARALSNRQMMLKLLSMNLYDMEANSRMERLVEFKTAYGASVAALDRCLQKFVPGLDEKGRQTFLYSLLPFIYGLYPYTVVTEKQRSAMEEAGIRYVYMSTYDMAYTFLRSLLGGLT